MSQSDIIISGPELSFKIYDGSLAEYLLQKLRALPLDNIIQVNGETGEQLSVRNFIKGSLAVAEGLKQLGLQAGKDIVPIIGDYSWNVIAAAIGGVLSGVAIYPIDFNYKAFELKQFFGPSQPRVIFCEKKCVEHVLEALDMLEIISAKIFLLDEDNSDNPRLHNFNDILKESDIHTYTPPVIACPEDTTALIATSSGTTGLPKGVMITHTNMLFQLQQFEYSRKSATFVAQNQPSLLQVTHIFWITGITGTILSCLTGHRNIFVRNATLENILTAIEKYKPDHALFPSALVTQMLSYPDFKKYDLSSLKLIAIGGSAFPKAAADRLQSEWPFKVIFGQGYGMTELSGGVTSSSRTNLYSVGGVRSGTQMKVIDLTTGKSLGPNKIGELRFKSRYGMMKGYLGDEEGTRGVFDETGFYCTGDMGYYTKDNQIFVVDRIKEFIQWKGHHVSPSEIESVILTIPGVEDVGVVGVPHEIEFYRPMALVVKSPEHQITEQDIVDYVAKNLSDQKHLRGGVKFVDAIPRTHNGKIKRHLLAELI